VALLVREPHATGFPALGASEVHAWRIDLDAVSVDEAVLGDAERVRAREIRDPGTRWRFTASRTAVRRVLAGYLGRAAAAVELGQRCPYCSGPHGLPRLAGDPPPLLVSIAHSGSLAALAVTRTGAVGVDVEGAVNGRLSPLRIAERRFAPEEVVALRSAPEGERAAVFLRIWTRKEAYLKATGEGLARPMSSFAVSASEPAALLRSDGDDAARWAVVDLPLPRAMAGAVVLPTGYSLRVLDLPAATAAGSAPWSAGPGPTAPGPGTPARPAGARTSDGDG
jgi:4'-phosphopantetheinyl transferase